MLMKVTLKEIRELVRDQMLDFEALACEDEDYEEEYEYYSDLYQGLITGNFEANEIDKLLNTWNGGYEEEDAFIWSDRENWVD